VTSRLSLASPTRTLGIVPVLIVLIGAGLWIWAEKAVKRDERKRDVQDLLSGSLGVDK
jgi:hypothetical protein